jgi:hypothetical protein
MGKRPADPVLISCDAHIVHTPIKEATRKAAEQTETHAVPTDRRISDQLTIRREPPSTTLWFWQDGRHWANASRSAFGA